jgi:hypothetical protein
VARDHNLSFTRQPEVPREVILHLRQGYRSGRSSPSRRATLPLGPS